MNVATLITSISPTSFAQATFNIQHLDNVSPDNAYVVFGLGPQSTVRGNIVTDVPMISGADPNNFYARVLCVFMVPGSTATDGFPAKYVGSFLPDGTGVVQNLEKYYNSANP